MLDTSIIFFESGLAVSIEELACLDGLLWLGSGERVSQKFCLSQSTVSRAARRAAAVFGVELVKGVDDWTLLGDPTHLNLERQLHQRLRWDRDGLLRLEAQYYSGPSLTEGLGQGFLLGNFDLLDVRRPLDLLRTGVIDSWIGGYPDVPLDDDPDFCSFHLNRRPLKLVVSPVHPLVQLGDAVTLDDVSAYPCLALKDGDFPVLQHRLEAMGLWNTPARMRRQNIDRWLGMTADQVTVGYATSFTIKLFPGPMVFLPLDLDCDVGDTLVIKREFVDHPRFWKLLPCLRSRAVAMAQESPDVTLPF